MSRVATSKELEIKDRYFLILWRDKNKTHTLTDKQTTCFFYTRIISSKCAYFNKKKNLYFKVVNPNKSELIDLTESQDNGKFFYSLGLRCLFSKVYQF